MKDIGKLCGGCFVHADSPDVDRAPYKGVGKLLIVLVILFQTSRVLKM